MRNSKFRKVSLFAASILAVSTIGVAAAGLVGCDSDASVPPVAVAAEITSGELPASSQSIGKNVDVPETVQVTYNGESYTASGCKVTSPDGLTKNVSGSLSLAKCGTYTLYYFFTDSDNVQRSATYEIIATDSYFTLSTGNESTYIRKSTSEDPLQCKDDGLIVDLTEGTTLTYNKPVDLRNADEEGLASVIAINPINGRIIEGTKNYSVDFDAKIVWVQMTDAYNPNLTVTLRMGRMGDWSGVLMSGVKTSRQSLIGLDNGAYSPNYEGCAKMITIDGVQHRYWYNEKGYANHNFPSLNTKTQSGIEWKYDYEAMRVYLTYVDDSGKENKTLLTDLDSEVIYENGTFFPGWTTGEVYVSVFAEGYEAASVRTEIVSIGGEKATDLYDARYSDTVAPEITVLQKKTTDTGIKAAVGEVVKIPEARVTDVNLVGSLEVSVYKNYGTQYQTAVTVTNGTFIPTRADEYTIVYSAKDGSGNVGTATFTVLAKATNNQKSIALSPMNPTADDLKIGIPFNLNRTVESALNVSTDDVDITVTVTHNGEQVSTRQDGTFIPLVAGEYTITYVYSDGVFSYNDAATYTFTANDATTFVDSIMLPKYMVKGNKYSLGDLSAYTFGSGAPVAADTKVYAVFDGGAEKLVDKDAVEITGNNTVKFVFKSGTATYETATMPIVDATSSLKQLFLGDFDRNEHPLLRDFTFVSKTTSGNNTLSFANRISARDFKFEYVLAEENANFSELRIKLTDSLDETKSYTLTLLNRGKDDSGNSISAANFNGGLTASLSGYPFSSPDILSITYLYSTRKLQIGSSVFFEDIDMPSGIGYLDVEFAGISGQAGICIKTINNQTISGTETSDGSEPQIYVNKKNGTYSVGDTVTLSVPEFSDVLSGIDYARTEFTIVRNNGKTVNDANGNPLSDLKWNQSYTILLDEIAVYTVKYTVYDFAGNYIVTSYRMTCADSTPPTITVENVSEGSIIRVKVGNQINIRFNVSDNISNVGELVTYLHVTWDDAFQNIANICGYGKDTIATDGKYDAKFTLTVKGEYTAIIQVWDKANNIAEKRIKIIVE